MTPGLLSVISLLGPFGTLAAFVVFNVAYGALARPEWGKRGKPLTAALWFCAWAASGLWLVATVWFVATVAGP